MPAVVGLAATKAAAAEYLEAGGRDIGVVIRVLRVGIGRCVGVGLGRVLDGNAVGVGWVSVKCGCGVGPWRAAAAQRPTNGRRQALVPAADHQSSSLPVRGHGTVGGGQAEVSERPGGRGDDGRVGWSRAQALRALRGSAEGPLHHAAVGDCSAMQPKTRVPQRDNAGLVACGKRWAGARGYVGELTRSVCGPRRRS